MALSAFCSGRFPVCAAAAEIKNIYKLIPGGVIFDIECSNIGRLSSCSIKASGILKPGGFVKISVYQKLLS